MKSQHPFGTGAAPVHPRAFEAHLKLLTTALQHATANRPQVFSIVQVAHPAVVVAKISGLFTQVISYLGLRVGFFVQPGRDSRGLTEIQSRFTALQLPLGLFGLVTIGRLDGRTQMVFGMIPIDNLFGLGKVIHSSPTRLTALTLPMLARAPPARRRVITSS
jgi:hypothetical protein